jgi:hypothetical protein
VAVVLPSGDGKQTLHYEDCHSSAQGPGAPAGSSSSCLPVQVALWSQVGESLQICGVGFLPPKRDSHLAPAVAVDLQGQVHSRRGLGSGKSLLLPPPVCRLLMVVVTHIMVVPRRRLSSGQKAEYCHQATAEINYAQRGDAAMDGGWRVRASVGWCPESSSCSHKTRQGLSDQAVL